MKSLKVYRFSNLVESSQGKSLGDVVEIDKTQQPAKHFEASNARCESAFRSRTQVRSYAASLARMHTSSLN